MKTTNISKLCEIHNCLKIFRERIVKGKTRKEWICSLCVKEQRALYRKDNKKEILASATEYRNKNRERINSSRKNNVKYKNSAKDYYETNKKQIISARIVRKKIRRETDPAFKIRENVSSMIRTMLKSNDSAKNGFSFLNYVDWSPEQLKDHLEQQFEPWMTWQNWGIFNSKMWDDNNSSTWTWQIDHIIPQSSLPCKSMEDDNFKKCWALENLRPYSAKLNCLDGANKVRHKK